MRDGKPMYGHGAAHRDFVHSLAFSSDETMLASGGYRVVKFWKRAQNVQKLKVAAPAEVTAVAMRGDGQLMALLLPITRSRWSMSPMEPPCGHSRDTGPKSPRSSFGRRLQKKLRSTKPRATPQRPPLWQRAKRRIATELAECQSKRRKTGGRESRSRCSRQSSRRSRQKSRRRESRLRQKGRRTIEARFRIAR